MKRDAENERPRYTNPGKRARDDPRKMVIQEKVTPLTGDEWALEAVKVPTLHKKRKWSAPGPDKITSF